jgi:histidinol-phosphate aminotransferase
VAALPVYSRAAGSSRVRWRASSNESTVAPSPAIAAAIVHAGASAHLYPTLTGEDLVDVLAPRLGVSTDQVVVGGGSLALLQQALTAYTGPGTEVVHAWRSYEAYPILIGVADADAVPVPLDAEFRHDVEAMLAAITDRTAAVLVCDPNNPTGTALAPHRLRELIELVPPHVLVLLDQAYQEFDEKSLDVAGVVADHPNVLVFRTFSKAYGLAGLRAGYAVGSPEVVRTMLAVAPPFGLNAIAEAAAVAAFSDVAHTDLIVKTVTESRTAFRAGLARRGIVTPDSRANFVWLPVGADAARLEGLCVEQGVSVRAFLGEGIRVTVGSPEAEEAVLAAVDVYLRG